MQSAVRKQDRVLVKLEPPNAAYEGVKKIFDEDVGDSDWIHSKAVFADLVANDPEFSDEFDFSAFSGLFDRLKNVIGAV